jgi:hypothetical protein
MKRQARPRVAARRRDVASLALKGWTQAAIARQLQIPQGTVSRDLAAMREFWREFPVYDFDKIRLEQLQKIDLVEAEAWAAWQRSQGRRHTAWLTRGKTGETTRTTSQDQFGDPRYLREVARCVEQRYEMIGVPPPEAPRGEPEVKVPDCELTDHFRYYLVLRQWFGDPPYHPVGRLQAEHYAALVAEHEHDPNLSKMVMRREEEHPTTPAGADGSPGGQGEQPPENTQSSGSGQGDSL